MNPDNPSIAGQQAEVIPQVGNPPQAMEVQTPEQIFARVLGYLYIEEEFITSTLNIQRIRSSRVAVVLTEQKHANVIEDAQGNANRSLYHDTVQFLRLLDAAGQYAKRQGVSVLEIQWNTFTEASTTRMIADFVSATKAKNEEIERSRTEALVLM